MQKLISGLLFLFPVLTSAHTEDFGSEMMGGMMAGWNMMGWGWFGFWPWIFALTWIVWLVIGILAVVWLWKKINK